MNMTTIIKSGARVVARYSGISRLLAFRYGGPGTIFALHSVVADPAPSPDDFLRCPVSTLERTLCWLKVNRIRIVSLDEALQRLASPPTERFCAFTFDDGYADNLTRALPVMERFNASFTVYVTSGMITGEIDAWWLGLTALIRSRDHIQLPAIGRRFDCADPASKKRTYAAITELINSNADACAALRRAFADSGIDCRALARSEGLSAEQLRRLANSPLVTIGAHGVRHVELTAVSTNEVEREMTVGRRLLEDIIGHEVVHFAYPFGAAGLREAKIARSLGFRTAVTTQRGTLFPEHLDHLHALPREPLFRHDTPSSLRCKIDGTYRAYYSRFRNPVAHM